MKLKNRYFILRHGQTIYQIKKKDYIYSWPEKPPVKLTKKGEKQVKVAAKKLKKEKLDLIFTSDFFRTRQTSRIVAQKLGFKTSQIHFDKRLRDINLGIYRGKTKAEFYKKFPKYSKIRFYKRPPQGESWLDCQKRILAFLKDTDKKFKGKTILIVSHGDPLWLLEGTIRNWSIKKMLQERVSHDIIETGEVRRLF
jgi:broad specificity phosphatase PhoE